MPSFTWTRRARVLGSAAATMLAAATILPATASGAVAPTASPRPASAAKVTPRATPGGANITWAPLFGGLNQPTQVLSPPDGSDRILAVQRPGQVRLYTGGVLKNPSYLNVRKLPGANVSSLYSIAFPQNFTSWPYVFSVHTNKDRTEVLTRWSAGSPANPGPLNPAKAQTVLTVQFPLNTVHFGSQLWFGTDGYLYMSTGDGAIAGQSLTSQDPTSLLGKVLRIQVQGCPGGALYCIPPDNPYVGSATARPEIWLIGLRNPFRITIDSANNDLWIGDVGEDRYEEVDRVPNAGGAGNNMGWPCYEGLVKFKASQCAPDTVLTAPIITLCHPDNVTLSCNDAIGAEAVIGGLVYRAQKWDDTLGGLYVFGDWETGKTVLSDSAGNYVVQPNSNWFPEFILSSYGTDNAGDLLASTLDGQVWIATVTANQ